MSPKKAKARTPLVKKAKSQVKHFSSPRSERDKIFCERYLVHSDSRRACEEAGIKSPDHNAARKLKQMSKYIDPLKAKIEEKLVQDLSYSRKDILDHMAAIALANPHDYYEEFEVLDQATGKMLTGRALKPIQRLTRLQASAIEDMTYHLESGRISYKLPSISTKMNALNTLAETVGVTKKKDDGGGQHVHFHDVPIEKLRALMQGFSTLLGPQASRQVLGLTEDDQND